MAEILLKAFLREFEVISQPAFIDYSLFIDEELLPWDYIIFKEFDQNTHKFTGRKIRRQIETVTRKSLWPEHPNRTFIKFLPLKVEVL